MRAYELMVILDGDLDEPVAQALDQDRHRPGRRPPAARCTASPTGGASGASPTRSSTRTRATTSCSTSCAEPGALDELERSLRLADDVVRHKLIRLPDAEAARRGLVEAGATA